LPHFKKGEKKTIWSHCDEILHEKWILNFKKYKTQKSKIGTRTHFSTSALLKKGQHWQLHRLQKDNSLTRKQYSSPYPSLQASADLVMMPL